MSSVYMCSYLQQPMLENAHDTHFWTIWWKPCTPPSIECRELLRTSPTSAGSSTIPPSGSLSQTRWPSRDFARQHLLSLTVVTDLIRFVTTVESLGDRLAVNTLKEQLQRQPSQIWELLIPCQSAWHGCFLADPFEGSIRGLREELSTVGYEKTFSWFY